VPPVQLLKGINRVAGTGSVRFTVFHPKRRMAGQGKPEHLHPLAKWCDGIAELVRWTGRGNEPNLVESPLFPAMLGQDEVAQVDGIESAAENTDAHETRSN
jgi:hypothetical protein